MMIARFYSNEHGQSFWHMEAMREHLESIGWQTHRYQITAVSDAEIVQQCDLVAVWSMGAAGRHIARLARTRGIDVLVFELGFLQDRKEFMGLSLLTPEGVHNNNGDWLASAEMPHDRLPVEVTSRKGRKGKRALVLGQVPGDSQLDGADIGAYTKYLIGKLEREGYEVKYRPHPHVEYSPQPLQEALDEADLVAGYNSTTFVECIRQGIPFICHDLCQYYPMASHLLPAKAKSKKEREQFLANLAYCEMSIADYKVGKGKQQYDRLKEFRS